MNWGFIGTGNIANEMIRAFPLAENAVAAAAWSRRPEQVREFCGRWGIPKACSSLDELLADPEIEAVYVATPHRMHLEHVCRALEAGKHVLCEKPMAMSEEETKRMAALAREKKRFLMEAYWTRFFPATDRIAELARSGRLGRVRHVSVEFGIHIPYDEKLRYFNRELGGGSLRGAGIYPIGFACTVLGGFPLEVKAIADMKNGVDLHAAALLSFPGGATATVQTGFDCLNTRSASISCEEGCIVVPHLINPDEIEIQTRTGTEKLNVPFCAPGLQYELREAVDCITAGKLESEKMTLDDSIGLARVFDRLYEQF